MNHFILYLLPEETSAGELFDCLDFLPPKALELWREANILEIATDTGTITFECIKDQLREPDLDLMEQISMKQIFSCDYQDSERLLLQKVMRTLQERYGGLIGSDTEDFQPYLKPEQL